MARLPQPGQDGGTWGEILNEFLTVEHNSDGTLKASGSLLNKYTKPPTGIPEADLSVGVIAKLNAGQTATVQSVNGHTGTVTLTKTDIDLSNVDNTSDAVKFSTNATLTNKTISGTANTFSQIPQSAIVNLSTDLQSIIDTKAALASPTFTGVPLVPTASAGTNTTQIASTGFVSNAITTATGGITSVYLTQAAYDALATKSSTTEYNIIP